MLTLSACTLRAYDGPAQPRSELVIIKGDYRVRAGAPVSVILRRVDDRTLDLRHSAVTIEPGKHELLADCLVKEYDKETRHSLQVDLDAGVYRLVPEMAPGNRSCATVRLEAVH